MKAQLEDYIRAGYGGLTIVTPEYVRCEETILRVAKETNSRMFLWDAQGTVMNAHDCKKVEEDLGDLNEILIHIGESVNTTKQEEDAPEHTLWVLSDVHLYFDQPEPSTVALMRETIRMCKTARHHIILIGAETKLSPEVEKLFTQVEFSMPDHDAMAGILEAVRQGTTLGELDEEEINRICNAASGMTSVEAEDAFALAYMITKKEEGEGRFCHQIICREKARAVEKSGFLKYFDGRIPIEDVGGLENAIEYITLRKNSFTQEAINFGCDTPKGVITIGPPGTGKTMFAKAISSVLDRPLLIADIGALYGSLVGQSESNIRSMIQIAEAVAPCVLLFDEIEKGLSGSQSSGQTDGGTGSRVIGTLLSWMSDKTSEVYIVATANDVTALPPEVLRKGRFDEMFFVDLPSPVERKAIWKIHLSKKGLDTDKFSFPKLVSSTEGYTGAEIEQVVKDGMFTAFGSGKQLDDKILIDEIDNTSPLSVITKDKIDGLRKWADGRCRFATKDSTKGAEKVRQLG